ncbi:hypothetical protein MKX01_032240 [Papaver californicum]|nr:hypothetical protein MKX01_032240 [Papaver californicum]
MANSNYTVQCNGVNIVTTLTNSSLFIDSVLNEFRSKRVATLQLCYGTRCIIIQLLHLDVIPNSLRNLLMDRSVTFIGVGITQDIAKLDRDYGLKCWSVTELGLLADRVYGTQQFGGGGLVSLMRQIVGVRIEKPEHVTRSNWGRNILNTEQIKYATIDAYASFEIGSRLLGGYN